MFEGKGCGCVVIICIAVTILIFVLSGGESEGALIVAAGAIVAILVLWFAFNHLFD